MAAALLAVLIAGGLVALVANKADERSDKTACQTTFRTVLTAIEASKASDLTGDGSYPVDGEALVTQGFLQDFPATVRYTQLAGGSDFKLEGIGSCGGLGLTAGGS